MIMGRHNHSGVRSISPRHQQYCWNYKYSVKEKYWDYSDYHHPNDRILRDHNNLDFSNHLPFSSYDHYLSRRTSQCKPSSMVISSTQMKNYSDQLSSNSHLHFASGSPPFPPLENSSSFFSDSRPRHTHRSPSCSSSYNPTYSSHCEYHVNRLFIESDQEYYNHPRNNPPDEFDRYRRLMGQRSGDRVPPRNDHVDTPNKSKSFEKQRSISSPYRSARQYHQRSHYLMMGSKNPRSNLTDVSNGRHRELRDERIKPSDSKDRLYGETDSENSPRRRCRLTPQQSIDSGLPSHPISPQQFQYEFLQCPSMSYTESVSNRSGKTHWDSDETHWDSGKTNWDSPSSTTASSQHDSDNRSFNLEETPIDLICEDTESPEELKNQINIETLNGRNCINRTNMQMQLHDNQNQCFVKCNIQNNEKLEFVSIHQDLCLEETPPNTDHQNLQLQESPEKNNENLKNQICIDETLDSFNASNNKLNVEQFNENLTPVSLNENISVDDIPIPRLANKSQIQSLSESSRDEICVKNSVSQTNEDRHGARMTVSQLSDCDVRGSSKNRYSRAFHSWDNTKVPDSQKSSLKTNLPVQRSGESSFSVEEIPRISEYNLHDDSQSGHWYKKIGRKKPHIQRHMSRSVSPSLVHQSSSIGIRPTVTKLSYEDQTILIMKPVAFPHSSQLYSPRSSGGLTRDSYRPGSRHYHNQQSPINGTSPKTYPRRRCRNTAPALPCSRTGWRSPSLQRQESQPFIIPTLKTGLNDELGEQTREIQTECLSSFEHASHDSRPESMWTRSKPSITDEPHNNQSLSDPEESSSVKYNDDISLDIHEYQKENQSKEKLHDGSINGDGQREASDDIENCQEDNQTNNHGPIDSTIENLNEFNETEVVSFQISSNSIGKSSVANSSAVEYVTFNRKDVQMEFQQGKDQSDKMMRHVISEEGVCQDKEPNLTPKLTRKRFNISSLNDDQGRKPQCNISESFQTAASESLARNSRQKSKRCNVVLSDSDISNEEDDESISPSQLSPPPSIVSSHFFSRHGFITSDYIPRASPILQLPRQIDKQREQVRTVRDQALKQGRVVSRNVNDSYLVEMEISAQKQEEKTVKVETVSSAMILGQREISPISQRRRSISRTIDKRISSKEAEFATSTFGRSKRRGYRVVSSDTEKETRTDEGLSPNESDRLSKPFYHVTQDQTIAMDNVSNSTSAQFPVIVATDLSTQGVFFPSNNTIQKTKQQRRGEPALPPDIVIPKKRSAIQQTSRPQSVTRSMVRTGSKPSAKRESIPIDELRKGERILKDKNTCLVGKKLSDQKKGFNSINRELAIHMSSVPNQRVERRSDVRRCFGGNEGDKHDDKRIVHGESGRAVKQDVINKPLIESAAAKADKVHSFVEKIGDVEIRTPKRLRYGQSVQPSIQPSTTMKADKVHYLAENFEGSPKRFKSGGFSVGQVQKEDSLEFGQELKGSSHLDRLKKRHRILCLNESYTISTQDIRSEGLVEKVHQIHPSNVDSHLAKSKVIESVEGSISSSQLHTSTMSPLVVPSSAPSSRVGFTGIPEEESVLSSDSSRLHSTLSLTDSSSEVLPRKRKVPLKKLMGTKVEGLPRNPQLPLEELLKTQVEDLPESSVISVAESIEGSIEDLSIEPSELEDLPESPIIPIEELLATELRVGRKLGASESVDLANHPNRFFLNEKRESVRTSSEIKESEQHLLIITSPKRHHRCKTELLPSLPKKSRQKFSRELCSLYEHIIDSGACNALYEDRYRHSREAQQKVKRNSDASLVKSSLIPTETVDNERTKAIVKPNLRPSEHRLSSNDSLRDDSARMMSSPSHRNTVRTPRTKSIYNEMPISKLNAINGKQHITSSHHLPKPSIPKSSAKTKHRVGVLDEGTSGQITGSARRKKMMIAKLDEFDSVYDLVLPAEVPQRRGIVLLPPVEQILPSIPVTLPRAPTPSSPPTSVAGEPSVVSQNRIYPKASLVEDLKISSIAEVEHHPIPSYEETLGLIPRGWLMDRFCQVGNSEDSQLYKELFLSEKVRWREEGRDVAETDDNQEVTVVAEATEKEEAVNKEIDLSPNKPICL